MTMQGTMTKVGIKLVRIRMMGMMWAVAIVQLFDPLCVDDLWFRFVVSSALSDGVEIV